MVWEQAALPFGKKWFGNKRKKSWILGLFLLSLWTLREPECHRCSCKKDTWRGPSQHLAQSVPLKFDSSSSLDPSLESEWGVLSLVLVGFHLPLLSLGLLGFCFWMG
jgi:hypothetical protein